METNGEQLHRDENPLSRISHKIDEFSRKVGQFEPTDGLLRCWQLSNFAFTNDAAVFSQQGQVVTLWFLAYLAKELLLSPTNTSQRKMTEAEFNNLSDFYHKIEDSAVSLAETQEGDKGLPWLIKANYEQLFYQQPITVHQQTCRDMFHRVFPMGFDVLFKVGIAISFAFMRSPTLDKSFITETNIPFLKSALSLKNLDLVLDNLVTNYREFSTEQRRFVHKHHYERKYEFNYLRKRPLIKMNDGRIICPIPFLIADRITNGVHFEIMDYCQQSDLDYQTYTTAYGHVFNAYVGKCLGEAYTHDEELIDADKHFASKHQKPICDWVVIEDRAVTLIECKSSKLPLELQSNGDPDSLRAFFIDRYLNGGKLQFEFLHEHYRNQGFTVYTIVVYNDSFDMYNEYKKILELQPEIVRNIDQYRTQFLSIYDLELLVPMLRSLPLHSVLERKLSDTESGRMPFGEFLSQLPEYSHRLALQATTSAWSEMCEGLV
jgi:hypothetical protein